MSSYGEVSSIHMREVLERTEGRANRNLPQVFVAPTGGELYNCPIFGRSTASPATASERMTIRRRTRPADRRTEERRRNCRPRETHGGFAGSG